MGGGDPLAALWCGTYKGQDLGEVIPPEVGVGGVLDAQAPRMKWLVEAFDKMLGRTRKRVWHVPSMIGFNYSVAEKLANFAMLAQLADQNKVTLIFIDPHGPGTISPWTGQVVREAITKEEVEDLNRESLEASEASKKGTDEPHDDDAGGDDPAPGGPPSQSSLQGMATLGPYKDDDPMSVQSPAFDEAYEVLTTA